MPMSLSASLAGGLVYGVADKILICYLMLIFPCNLLFLAHVVLHAEVFGRDSCTQ